MSETGHLLVEQEQQIQNLLKQLQILVSRYPGCSTVITFREMEERSGVGVVVATPVENGIELKGEAAVIDETEASTVHEGEVPDPQRSPEGSAADDVEAAGDPGVPMRDAQQSDVAPDESVLIEVDLAAIPARLRLSEVMAVYRAAGMRLRIAVDDVPMGDDQ